MCMNAKASIGLRNIQTLNCTVITADDVTFTCQINKVSTPSSIQRNNFLVFTKSLNSNFRAIRLAPVTRNILGFSLFCDKSQDGVQFRDIFGRRNLSDK